MTADEKLLELIFAPWKAVQGAGAIPTESTLSKALVKSVASTGSTEKKFEFYIERQEAKYFATAAVDIWHRAVHSLLVSVLVSEQSPLWSAVSGYYASHYTVRGLAHLLGNIQLFKEGGRIQLSIDNGRYMCTYIKGRKREHNWYWDVVSASSTFGKDPFFHLADAEQGLADVAHRDRSNYSDHLPGFPNIKDANIAVAQRKMERFSRLEIATPPPLALSKFPDVENVQIRAYQRISRFRRYLDKALDQNRMWQVHRNPSWAMDFTDFQIIEPRGAGEI